MKLVVGLGNPGPEYLSTRHNAGILFIDELQKTKLPAGVIVKKSATFMNQSGDFVKRMVDKYEVPSEDLYIVHDDLDIRLGEYKIQLGHGPKDHNGLNDIYERLGSDNFWHIRIGIDNRPLDNKVLGVEYVLQNFTQDEMETISKVIKEASHDLINRIKSAKSE